MTHDEIDKLEAGRKLDALVAEKVMGWISGNSATVTTTGDVKWFETPAYSTSISAAWEVVEKFEDSEVFRNDDDNGPIEWHCRLGYWKTGILGHGIAPTAPLAICRAALKAVVE